MSFILTYYTQNYLNLSQDREPGDDDHITQLSILFLYSWNFCLFTECMLYIIMSKNDSFQVIQTENLHYWLTSICLISDHLPLSIISDMQHIHMHARTRTHTRTHSLILL